MQSGLTNSFARESIAVRTTDLLFYRFIIDQTSKSVVNLNVCQAIESKTDKQEVRCKSLQ